MAHWQHTPADVDERLVELAHLFLASRDAFFETADRFQWTPASGSVAERAASELVSPDPAITKPRGETGHRLVAEVVQTYLLTATGHLGGLASLYATGEVLFPPPALIRATIENCAHAMWVLGEDPDEPAENRLARAYLEEHLSAIEAKKNAGRMRDKTHPSHVRANEYYRVLRSEILTRFPTSTRESLGMSTLNEQVLLSPEATVTWMYAVTERLGGTIGDRAASGIYGFLSNMTHPTLYPARQRREWIDDPEAGHRVAYLRVDIGSRESEARAALAAFYNALTYVTDYFGWPNEVMDDLTVKIQECIPTFFR